MATATQQVRLLYRTLSRHFNEGKTSWGKNELVQEIAKVYIAFLEDMDLDAPVEKAFSKSLNEDNFVNDQMPEEPF